MLLALHHVLYCWMWFCCLIQSGSKHLNFLDFSSSAGKGRLWFKGAVMYESIARYGSYPPSMALVRLFLIVCTKCSAWPLDCALVGDVILCCMSHLLVKSLNSCDVNCVPSTETMHLSTPIYVKIIIYGNHCTLRPSVYYYAVDLDL